MRPLGKDDDKYWFFRDSKQSALRLKSYPNEGAQTNRIGLIVRPQAFAVVMRIHHAGTLFIYRWSSLFQQPSIDAEKS